MGWYGRSTFEELQRITPMIKTAFLKYKTLGVFIGHSILAALFVLTIFLGADLEKSISLIAVILIVYIALVKRFDYLDPFVGYLIPWIIILFFSTTRLSRFAVSIHAETYTLIIMAFTGAMFAAGARATKISAINYWVKPSKLRLKSRTVFLLIDIFFLFFTALNIMVAGYVPLLRGLSGGDTEYLEFGIHGVFGFYLALANALAIVNFIIFLRTGRRIYIVRYIAILLIFVAFITRQNLISVLVESVVAYSLVRGRIKLRTILVVGVLSGIVFSIIGSLRSGSVRDIAGIEKEYSWVPEPVIWLYAYSYFNIANLDKMLYQSNAPYYNASSLSQLIPSFLRPKYETENYLLVSNFNVSSYMYPVYEDLGRTGVLFLTVTALWLTSRQYRKLNQVVSIGGVGIYSALYFCASFSFFVNFWFFLPIIAQIIFFKMLSNISEVACASGKGRVQGSRFKNSKQPQILIGQ
jgi:oligosaccharide repeat unit polymerase